MYRLKSLKINTIVRDKKNRLLLSLGFLIFYASVETACAKELFPRYGVFVYSSFCRSSMSGDLYGNRITILRMIDGDTVIYEYTDGSTHAVVADTIKIENLEGKVSFDIHVDSDLHTTVNGQLTSDGKILNARGMLFNEKSMVNLILMHDFTAPIPICKKDR